MDAPVRISRQRILRVSSSCKARAERRAVPIRQTVEHTGRALCAAIARIRNESGKRNRLQAPKLRRRLLDEQADFPVTRVIAQRERFSIGISQTALRAQNEKLFAPCL